MKLAHFYHVFADGAWEFPVAQHVAALSEADFRGPVLLGLVGAPERRLRAANAIRQGKIAAEEDTGWEQVTLAALRAWALEHPGEAVLYAHSKGAAQPSGKQDDWRASMQLHTVSGWRHCLDQLEAGHDAVGCHWLTPAEYPTAGIIGGFFGGNYWMATTDYLATLPLCTLKDRWQAELWVGLGHPNVYDLLPGWPSDDLFAQGRTDEGTAVRR